MGGSLWGPALGTWTNGHWAAQTGRHNITAPPSRLPFPEHHPGTALIQGRRRDKGRFGNYTGHLDRQAGSINFASGANLMSTQSIELDRRSASGLLDVLIRAG